MEIKKADIVQLQKQEESFRKYRDDLKNQHEKSLQELQNHHEAELKKVDTQFKNERKQIEGAYKVTLSKEVEGKKDELNKMLSEHEKQKAIIEKQHKEEFEKLAARENARAESYRKNQEKTLSKLHEKYQYAQDEMNKNNGGDKS
jgi:hypothetical protein